MMESIEWIEGTNIGYRMGVDGISMFFVLLSTLLTPICILASWEAIEHRVREYMVAFYSGDHDGWNVLCLDILVFYIFFEGVLIPMFIIIGVWGGARRVYASSSSFVYFVRISFDARCHSRYVFHGGDYGHCCS